MKYLYVLCSSSDRSQVRDFSFDALSFFPFLKIYIT